MADICSVCRSDFWQAMERRPDYRICRSCGTGRLDQLPAAIDTIFNDTYFTGGTKGGYANYEADELLHRRNAQRRLSRLGLVSGRILDVGCAHGFGLDEASRSGLDAVGVEVAPAAADAARARGFQVTTSIEQADGAFDAVCFFQSLEHLVDPATALDAAVRMLRPAGMLMIETWDRSSYAARVFGSRWQQLSPPAVVWLFDRRGLLRLCHDRGLEGTVRRTMKWISLGLATSTGANAMSLTKPIDSFVQQRPRLRARALPYLGDDLVTVIAKTSNS